MSMDNDYANALKEKFETPCLKNGLWKPLNHASYSVNGALFNTVKNGFINGDANARNKPKILPVDPTRLHLLSERMSQLAKSSTPTAATTSFHAEKNKGNLSKSYCKFSPSSSTIKQSKEKIEKLANRSSSKESSPSIVPATSSCNDKTSRNHYKASSQDKKEKVKGEVNPAQLSCDKPEQKCQVAKSDSNKRCNFTDSKEQYNNDRQNASETNGKNKNSSNPLHHDHHPFRKSDSEITLDKKWKENNEPQTKDETKKHKHNDNHKNKDKSKSSRNDSKENKHGEKDKKRDSSHKAHTKNSESTKKEDMNEKSYSPELTKEECLKKIILSEYLKLRKEREKTSNDDAQHKISETNLTTNKLINNSDETLSQSPLLGRKRSSSEKFQNENHKKKRLNDESQTEAFIERAIALLSSSNERSICSSSQINNENLLSTSPGSFKKETGNNRIVDFNDDADTAIDYIPQEKLSQSNDKYSPNPSQSCGNIVIDFDLGSKSSSKVKARGNSPSLEKHMASEKIAYSNKVIDFAEHPKKKENKKKKHEKSSEHSTQLGEDLMNKSIDSTIYKDENKEKLKDSSEYIDVHNKPADNNTVIDFEFSKEVKKCEKSLNSGKHISKEKNIFKKDKKKEKYSSDENFSTKSPLSDVKNGLSKGGENTSSTSGKYISKHEGKKEKKKKTSSTENLSGNKIIDFEIGPNKSVKDQSPNSSFKKNNQLSDDSESAKSVKKAQPPWNNASNKLKKEKSPELSLNSKGKTNGATSKNKYFNNEKRERSGIDDTKRSGIDGTKRSGSDDTKRSGIDDTKRSGIDDTKSKTNIKIKKPEESFPKPEKQREGNSKYKHDDKIKKEKVEQGIFNGKKGETKCEINSSKESKTIPLIKEQEHFKEKFEKLAKEVFFKYDGNKVIDFKASSKELDKRDKIRNKSKSHSPISGHPSSDHKLNKESPSNENRIHEAKVLNHPSNTANLSGKSVTNSEARKEKMKTIMNSKSMKKNEKLNDQKEGLTFKNNGAREETFLTSSKTSLPSNEKKQCALKRKSPESDLGKNKKARLDNSSNHLSSKKGEHSKDFKPSILPISNSMLSSMGQGQRPPPKLHPLHRDYRKFQDIVTTKPPSLGKEQEYQGEIKELKAKVPSKENNKASKEKTSKILKNSKSTPKDQPVKKELNTKDLNDSNKRLKSPLCGASPKTKIEIPDNHPFLEDLNTPSHKGKKTKDDKEKYFFNTTNDNSKMKSDFKDPNISLQSAKNALLSKKNMDKYPTRNTENKPPLTKGSNMKSSMVLQEGLTADTTLRYGQTAPNSYPVYIPTPKSKLAQLQALKKPTYQEYDPMENAPKSISQSAAEYIPTKISLLQEKKKLREMSNIPKSSMEYKPTSLSKLPRDEADYSVPLKSSGTIPGYYPTHKKPLPPPKKLPPIGSYYSKLKKRKIMSSDEEEEYDEEMDDFIDDGPVDGLAPDYSSIINGVLKEVFNYDKTKYIGMDDEDDEDMESSFVEQMKEERRSARIGLMEDLEDIEREEQEKELRALKEAKKKAAKGGPKKPRKAYGNSFIF